MNENKLVVVFMGSKKDREHISGIIKTLDKFEIPYEIRALSAHKLPSKVLEEAAQYDSMDREIIYIVVAGKSNALGPLIAGNSSRPVINCPVIGSWKEDIFSALRMPTAVPCSTVLKPKNAALHAIKIFSLSDKRLRNKFEKYMENLKESLKKDDEALR